MHAEQFFLAVLKISWLQNGPLQKIRARYHLGVKQNGPQLKPSYGPNLLRGLIIRQRFLLLRRVPGQRHPWRQRHDRQTR